MARWPTMPVNVAPAPLRSTLASSLALASAYTRSDAPSVPSIVKAMSPLVAFAGATVIVPADGGEPALRRLPGLAGGRG